MTILLLKLTLSPAVIAGASLIARRFGPAVGGWLIGLPVTAGPVVLLLALEHGAVFATGAAHGLVIGVSAEVAFVLAYVALARHGRGWGAPLAAGSAAFAATGVALESLGLSFGVLLPLALVALLVGLRVVPRGVVMLRPAHSRHELALRMVAATVLVFAITGFATTLGAGLSGVATTYPLLSTILAVSVHRTDPRAAIAVYRGLLFGLFALTGFATTLALVLTRLPVAGAFAIAVLLTLTIQAGSLRPLQRSASLGA